MNSTTVSRGSKEQRLVSYLTNESLSELRRVSRPRTGFFHDVYAVLQPESLPKQLNVAAQTSQLLKEDRDKASRIGNSMQTKDNEYKLKLSMIFFDKKNNHLRSPETAQQPRGKEKDRKAAEYESSCKKKVASFEQLVKSIDNHKPEQIPKKLVLEKVKQQSLTALKEKLDRNSKEVVYEYAKKVLSVFQEEVLRERQAWKEEQTQLGLKFEEQRKERLRLEQCYIEQLKANDALSRQIKVLQQKERVIRLQKLRLEQSVPFYKELEKHFKEAKDLSVLINYQQVEDRCLKLFENHRLQQEESLVAARALAESKKIKELELQKKEMEAALTAKEQQIAKLADKKYEAEKIAGFKQELDQLKSFISTKFFPHCRFISSAGQQQLRNISEIEVLKIVCQYIEDVREKKLQQRQLEKNRKVYANLKEIKKRLATVIRREDKGEDEVKPLYTPAEMSSEILLEVQLLIKRYKQWSERHDRDEVRRESTIEQNRRAAAERKYFQE